MAYRVRQGLAALMLTICLAVLMATTPAPQPLPPEAATTVSRTPVHRPAPTPALDPIAGFIAAVDQLNQQVNLTTAHAFGFDQVFNPITWLINLFKSPYSVAKQSQGDFDAELLVPAIYRQNSGRRLPPAVSFTNLTSGTAVTAIAPEPDMPEGWRRDAAWPLRFQFNSVHNRLEPHAIRLIKNNDGQNLVKWDGIKPYRIKHVPTTDVITDVYDAEFNWGHDDATHVVAKAKTVTLSRFFEEQNFFADLGQKQSERPYWWYPARMNGVHFRFVNEGVPEVKVTAYDSAFGGLDEAMQWELLGNGQKTTVFVAPGMIVGNVDRGGLSFDPPPTVKDKFGNWAWEIPANWDRTKSFVVTIRPQRRVPVNQTRGGR